MDMKPRLFLRLSLLAVFVTSCAPATVPVPPDTTTTAVIRPTATALQLPTETVSVEAGETPLPTPIPVATSRGPDLEATDPSTVSLTSGQIQFVEFFRFT